MESLESDEKRQSLFTSQRGVRNVIQADSHDRWPEWCGENDDDEEIANG